MGNHQDHTFVVFNHNAHKVMMDAIFYARIQANNLYYKEVLHKKLIKKLGFFSYLLDQGVIPSGKES
jgi:hypothetical protein